MSLWQKYKYHLGIVFMALGCVQVFDFLTQIGAQGIIYPDAASYHEAAKNMYVFLDGHNYRPILLAAIQGIPYLFGASDDAIHAFSYYQNLIFWIGFFLVVFALLKLYIKPKKAFLFAVGGMFFIGNLPFVFYLFSEIIYMFFMILGFYFLAQYDRKNMFRDLAIALAIFILAMLIKPGSMYLAIVFTLYFIRRIIRNYKDKFAWFIYGSLGLVVIQCAGLKYQFGNFTISYIDAVTFYGYIGERATALKEGDNYQKRADIYSYPCPVQKQMAAADMKDQLFNNTENLIKAYSQNMYENATMGSLCLLDCKNVKARSDFDFWQALLYDISVWQNRIFSIVTVLLSAACLIMYCRRNPWIAFLAFFILYNLILSGISHGEGDRFNVITFPFALILLAILLKDKTKILD